MPSSTQRTGARSELFFCNKAEPAGIGQLTVILAERAPMARPMPQAPPRPAEQEQGQDQSVGQQPRRAGEQAHARLCPESVPARIAFHLPDVEPAARERVVDSQRTRMPITVLMPWLQEGSRSDEKTTGFQDAPCLAQRDRREAEMFEHSERDEEIEGVVPERQRMRIGEKHGRPFAIQADIFKAGVLN